MAYSDGVDELIIGDFAIAILIEVIVNASKLLGGHEDAQLGAHLLELKLVQSARLVSIEFLH